MTGIEFFDWLIGTVVALGGAFGVVAGGMKMVSEGRALRTTPKTPYDQLEARLVKVEESDEKKSKELSRLRSQVYRLAGVLTREVNTLIVWHETGRNPPPPDREVAAVRDVISEIQEDQRSSND